MLLKISGMILVLLSCSLIGLSFSGEYEERIEDLKKIRKMLALLKGEISYNNATINEAISNVAERVDSNMSFFLKAVVDEFEKNEGTLKEAWNYAVENILGQKTKLREKDLVQIEEIGKNLGITDRETQINNILGCVEAIGMIIDELNENRTEKCKLYKCLGVMSGAFLIVVLV